MFIWYGGGAVPAMSTLIPPIPLSATGTGAGGCGCNNIEEPAIGEPYTEYVPLSIVIKITSAMCGGRDHSSTYLILNLAICVHTRELVDSVGDDGMGMGVEMWDDGNFERERRGRKL
jgi:hypothetical protein